MGYVLPRVCSQTSLLLCVSQVCLCFSWSLTIPPCVLLSLSRGLFLLCFRFSLSTVLLSVLFSSLSFPLIPSCSPSSLFCSTCFVFPFLSLTLPPTQERCPVRTSLPRPALHSACLPSGREPRAEVGPAMAGRGLPVASPHILSHSPCKAFPAALPRTEGTGHRAQRPDQHCEDGWAGGPVVPPSWRRHRPFSCAVLCCAPANPQHSSAIGLQNGDVTSSTCPA